MKSKTCFQEVQLKKVEINMNPKNATHVKAFTSEDPDIILRLMTSAICTSGWLFLIPRKGAKLKVVLSQKVQDSFFIAIFAIIIIPFYYLKLLHPVHDNDKLLI